MRSLSRQNLYKSTKTRGNSITSRTNNSHHPSQQTQSNPYRPSIKVGYKIIPHVIEQKRYKKRVQPPIYANNMVDKANCKKKVDDVKAQICGKFIGAQYIKQQKVAPMFQKKGVSQCRQMHQKSEAVKQNIQSQYFSNNRNSRNSRSSSVANTSSSRDRNQLPSYQNTGIKDIMEYHHALPYRQTKITEKCTSSNALSRFFKFQQLHEYDFRKRPQFLR